MTSLKVAVVVGREIAFHCEAIRPSLDINHMCAYSETELVAQYMQHFSVCWPWM
jgi:hypothetical protein